MLVQDSLHIGDGGRHLHGRRDEPNLSGHIQGLVHQNSLHIVSRYQLWNMCLTWLYGPMASGAFLVAMITLLQAILVTDGGDSETTPAFTVQTLSTVNTCLTSTCLAQDVHTTVRSGTLSHC